MLKHFDDTDFNLGLISLAETNNLKDLEYYLTALKTKDLADIHNNDDCILNTAVWHGHLDIIKFVLESPLLSEKIKLKDNASYVFPVSSNKGYIHLLKYFFDFIERTHDEQSKNILEQEKPQMLLETIRGNKKRTFVFLLNHFSHEIIINCSFDVVKHCCVHNRPKFLRSFLNFLDTKKVFTLNQTIDFLMPRLLTMALEYNNTEILKLLSGKSTLDNLKIALLNAHQRPVMEELLKELIIVKESLSISYDFKNRKKYYSLKL